MISQGMHRWFDRFIDLTRFSNRFFLNIAHQLRDSHLMFHISGKLRRFGLVHFRKRYIHRQLSVRQGFCRQCGTCCNLLFTCPMLTKQSRCLVYGTCRPQACKTFPIDQRDIDEVKLCSGLCGFRFGGESADKTGKIDRY